MQNHLGQRLNTKKMIGLRLLLRKKILNKCFSENHSKMTENDKK